MAKAYYNEIDPYAVQWLRNLIAAGHIAPGDVDDRSILDVRPHDLAGYTQCHFFAGIGGWSYAARLAGWADTRPLWTGSCPCQPFSIAGKQEGQADERHLWPVFFELIRSCRPDVVMGEQVAAAVGKHWLDGVHSDLEGIGYACGATVVPACAVDAPHRRDRLWFVAGANARQCDEPDEALCARRDAVNRGGAAVADASGIGRARLTWDEEAQRTPVGSSEWNDARNVGNPDQPGRDQFRHGSLGEGPRGEIQARPLPPGASRRSHWANGQAQGGRRVEPSIRLLAHGVPARVGKLRAYGNAIVPQVAAEIIAAYMDARAAA